MLKNKKKLMIPVLALVLVVAMAGTAFAALDWGTHVFDVNKRFSYDKDQTYLIQKVLTYTHYPKRFYPNGIDGQYGSGTEDAVEEFQKCYSSLSNDGEVGNNTWNKLGPHWPIQANEVTTYDHWDYSTYDYYQINGHKINTEYVQHVRRRTSNDKWYVYVGGVWKTVD